MRVRTITVRVTAGRDEVFDWLSEMNHLPAWAPAFCGGLRREGAYWRASTPGGCDLVALLADRRTGVIDLLLGPEADELTIVPMRVVHQPRGAAVIATMLQAAGWSDEHYERYYHGLLAALRGLVPRFAGGECFGPPTPEPFYPSLVTEKFAETWDFYAGQLGFQTVCESDTYVHLQHPAGAQLGILRAELNGAPSELVPATTGRGFWFNLEVADADAEHARLAAAGADIAEPPEDKPWGERRFTVRDPNGVLVGLAHRTVRAADALAALPAAL